MRLASESGREGVERADLFDDGVATQAALSTALVSILRGKFCDVILLDRQPLSFAKGDVIYTAGDKERTLFFLKSGYVKIGAITADGNELIYDVRKGGDVVGELCAAESERPDRAVALEPTEAIPVPFEDVKSLLMSDADESRAQDRPSGRFARRNSDLSHAGGNRADGRLAPRARLDGS